MSFVGKWRQMMHAYVEDYLPRAMKNLGEAFACAQSAWKVLLIEFQV